VPVGAPATTGTLPADLAARDGRLVLLQFSSAFCRSCRDTRGVLDDVAAELPGLVHRDVDLASRPELVRPLGLDRTPTTLLVDGRGRELLRVSGVPRRAALVSAIEPHLPPRD
jgi:thiol-disulfide isomerase/thioredoxin